MVGLMRVPAEYSQGPVDWCAGGQLVVCVRWKLTPASPPKARRNWPVLISAGQEQMPGNVSGTVIGSRSHATSATAAPMALAVALVDKKAPDNRQTTCCWRMKRELIPRLSCSH